MIEFVLEVFKTAFGLEESHVPSFAWAVLVTLMCSCVPHHKRSAALRSTPALRSNAVVPQTLDGVLSGLVTARSVDQALKSLDDQAFFLTTFVSFSQSPYSRSATLAEPRVLLTFLTQEGHIVRLALNTASRAEHRELLEILITDGFGHHLGALSFDGRGSGFLSWVKRTLADEKILDRNVPQADLESCTGCHTKNSLPIMPDGYYWAHWASQQYNVSDETKELDRLRRQAFESSFKRNRRMAEVWSRFSLVRGPEAGGRFDLWSLTQVSNHILNKLNDRLAAERLAELVVSADLAPELVIWALFDPFGGGREPLFEQPQGADGGAAFLERVARLHPERTLLEWSAQLQHWRDFFLERQMRILAHQQKEFAASAAEWFPQSTFRLKELSNETVTTAVSAEVLARVVFLLQSVKGLKADMSSLLPRHSASLEGAGGQATGGLVRAVQSAVLERIVAADSRALEPPAGCAESMIRYVPTTSAFDGQTVSISQYFLVQQDAAMLRKFSFSGCDQDLLSWLSSQKLGLAPTSPHRQNSCDVLQLYPGLFGARPCG